MKFLNSNVYFFIFLKVILFLTILHTQEDEKKEIGNDTPAEVKSLIDQLASDDFATREKATEKLIENGAFSYKHLFKYANTNDAEQKWRIEKIIQTIKFVNIDVRNTELKEKLKCKLNKLVDEKIVKDFFSQDREFWYFITDVLGYYYKINILCSHSFGEMASFNLENFTLTGDEIIQEIRKQLNCESRIVNGFLTFGTKEELDAFEKNLEKFKSTDFKFSEKISSSPINFVHREEHFVDLFRRTKDLYVDVTYPVNWRTFHCWTVLYIPDDMPFEIAFKTIAAFLNYDIEVKNSKDEQHILVELKPFKRE